MVITTFTGLDRTRPPISPVPFEVIAGQLGHKGITQVVNVYARFRPTDKDMEWRDDAPARVGERAVRELAAV